MIPRDYITEWRANAPPAMDALRAVLDPWLGQPRWKQTEGRVTFVYRFSSEERPPVPLRLKVEINTREHFAVHGFVEQSFAASSRWFNGACGIKSYELNELLGTKLQALYQRRKGRDLFDLSIALERAHADAAEIIKAFRAYMDHRGHKVTRRDFEENLVPKLDDREF